MQNEIYDEKNGLTYMLCGDYYLPELALTDIEPTYGKYGMLRKSYLQEHRKAKYQILLLQGKLVEHLNQIDAEARDREEQLVKQMMEKQGITEKLKRQDNMEWTRRMNVICHDAEEIRGWINYFKIGSIKTLCKELDARIRYRLRMCIWKQWKTPQNRIKNLMKLGVDKDIAWITAYTGSRIAYVCQRRVMNFAINKERLTQFGLVSMIDYYTKRCVTC